MNVHIYIVICTVWLTYVTHENVLFHVNKSIYFLSSYFTHLLGNQRGAIYLRCISLLRHYAIRNLPEMTFHGFLPLTSFFSRNFSMSVALLAPNRTF